MDILEITSNLSIFEAFLGIFPLAMLIGIIIGIFEDIMRPYL